MPDWEPDDEDNDEEVPPHFNDPTIWEPGDQDDDE